MEIQKVCILVTLSLTLWSSLALLTDQRGELVINRWFALLIFLLALPQGYFYSNLTASMDISFYWAVLAQATLWLKGPIALAMVQIALGRHIPTVSAVHAIPFCLAITDLSLGSSPFILWGIGGALHALIYLVCGAHQLSKGQLRLRTIFHEYPNSAYYWLLCVVAGLFVIIAADLVLMGFCWWQGSMNLEILMPMSWLISAYLFGIAFCILYRPEWFFKQKDRSQPNFARGNSMPEATPRPVAKHLKLIVNRDAKEKNWRELDESLAVTLTHSLAALMEEQIYRQHELTLGDLSARLGISLHQASELLNVHLGQSFYDFMNRARLAYACQRLADPNCQQRIIDIAFEAGFSNKNSFYRYFREIYGITPVEFKTRAMKLASLPVV